MVITCLKNGVGEIAPAVLAPAHGPLQLGIDVVGDHGAADSTAAAAVDVGFDVGSHLHVRVRGFA